MITADGISWRIRGKFQAIGAWHCVVCEGGGSLREREGLSYQVVGRAL
jgi:hypothetical protein